jgi:hypothetical protein
MHPSGLQKACTRMGVCECCRVMMQGACERTYTTNIWSFLCECLARTCTHKNMQLLWPPGQHRNGSGQVCIHICMCVFVHA